MTLLKWRHKAWETIFEHARKAHAQNQYKMAEIGYNIALAFAECSGIEPCVIAQLLVLRGELFLAMQKYSKSEESLRNAVLLYDKNNLGTELDMAIALRDMSATLRIQGKLRLAAQLATLAQQYTVNSRRKLEKCFKIPAA